MQHLAKFSSKPEFFKPFHVECSCGVAGDFSTQREAHDWMESKHFSKLTGVAYGEFEEKEELAPVDAPQPPVEHPEIFLQPKQGNVKVPKGDKE